MALGKAKRGGAAHRQAGEMRLLDRERIEQAERIGKQRIEDNGRPARRLPPWPRWS